MALISYSEARKLLIGEISPLTAGTLPVKEALGMALAEPVTAHVTQPPFSASAMDGYAVQLGDGLAEGDQLTVIGEAPAGSPWQGHVGKGEAVRLFTGSAVPHGADHVIIQENVSRDGETITVTVAVETRANIRRAGVDFKEGEVLVDTGTCLQATHLSLISAGNIAEVTVHTRPRVSILCIGDELVSPGASLEAGQIVESLSPGLSALCRQWGADVIAIHRLEDALDAITEAIKSAIADSDIVVIVGGASVGDYDYAKDSFAGAGGRLVFNKVAMKPGKPVWFGAAGDARVLGLPGNPASALTCGWLFLKPLIERLSGQAVTPSSDFLPARLARPVSANGPREQFMRGDARVSAGGQVTVTPLDNQDSSLLSVFASANCLIHRPGDAPAAQVDEIISVLMIAGLGHAGGQR